MARFSVESAVLEKSVQEWNSCGTELEKLCAEVESIRGNLGFQIRGQERISARLRDSAAQLTTLGKRARSCAAVLDDSAYRYRFTEAKIQSNTGDWSGMVSLLQFGVVETSSTKRWDELSAEFAASGVLLESDDGRTWELGRVSEKVGLEVEDSSFQLWDSDDHTDWKKDFGEPTKQRYDPEKKEWVDDPTVKFRSPEHTILEGKAESKRESDFFRYHHEGGNWNVDARVGHSESWIKGTAGLYGYREDGSQYISPAVSAEVGFSTCLFAGTMGGTLGSDLLGLYGDAKVEFGKVEASAGADFSFADKSGKFNPQAYVHAGGEALIASIEGSAGTTVLGGKVGVKGKLEAGLDAHLKMGFQDGVLQFDAGAALGIGGSVSFEVDVGGMVDTVVDAASSAMETVGNAISDGVDAIASTCTSWMWWL